MTEKAIADSSFCVALLDSKDVFHAKASDISQRIDVELVFFDCVMNEVFSVMGKRAVEKKRTKEINTIYNKITAVIPKHIIIWTYQDIPQLYDQIVSLMKKHDGFLNFHDCLIALAAKERNIAKIVSFDADFDRLAWLERIF